MAGNPDTYVKLQLEASGDQNIHKFTGKMEFVMGGFDWSKSGVTQSPDVKNTAWFAGAEHTIVGKVQIAGWTFQSDPAGPLVFKLVRDKGYVYQRGAGRVIGPQGDVFELVQEHK